MFKKAHINLTKYYTTVTIVMFVSIIICFFIVITYFYYSDEIESINAFANEELSEHIQELSNKNNSVVNFTDKKQKLIYDDKNLNVEEVQSALRMFSFIKLTNGDILPLTITTKDIEQWATVEINNIDLSQPHILTYKINSSNDNRHRILLKEQKMIVDGEILGTIYVGKDVSIMWSVLQKVAYSSIIVIIIFTIVLFYSGRLIASRALKPVQEAIIRQKRFITDASHELKTPLSVILMGVEIIKTNNRDDKNETVIQDVQDEIRKMNKLIDNMLCLSKLDERESKLVTNEDVVQVAKTSIDNLTYLAKEKNIDIRLENDLPIIWSINSDDLGQMIYILVENAIKYTFNNGYVIVSLNVETDFLQIKVKDNGIGVSKNEQNLIFERFYRVDKARNRASNGSGLGLSILSSLVKKHNGNIKVYSQIGEGSLFIITLPKIT